MNDPGTFRIGPISFHGSYAPNGDGFTIRSVDGWIDAPGTRQATAERPVTDGAFDAPVFLGPREVTITGLCFYDTHYQGGRWQRLLSGLQQLGTISFSGDYLGMALHGSGRVIDWRFSEVLPGAMADYSVTVRATDPILYGELFTASALFAAEGTTVSVSNRGNAFAKPTIKLTGTMLAGYKIASQGHEYKVAQGLLPGQTHLIDMGTGWLSRDGVLQLGGVVEQVDTFTIPPGSKKNITVTPNPFIGSVGSIEVTGRDAWV